MYVCKCVLFVFACMCSYLIEVRFDGVGFDSIFIKYCNFLSTRKLHWDHLLCKEIGTQTSCFFGSTCYGEICHLCVFV